MQQGQPQGVPQQQRPPQQNPGQPNQAQQQQQQQQAYAYAQAQARAAQQAQSMGNSQIPQHSDSKTNEMIKRIGQHVGWVAILIASICVVAYGFRSGDVTPREATTLLNPQILTEQNFAPTASNTELTPAEPTSYGYFVHAVSGLIHLPVTADFLRLASVLGVLCSALLIYFWLNKEAGQRAARVAAIGFIFSLPALVMGSFGTSDALFAFSVLATFCCIAEGTKSGPISNGIDFARLKRVAWVVSGCLLARFTEVLANGIESTWRSNSIGQSAISPFAVFLTALPTAFGCLAICRIDFWSDLAPRSRTCVIGGLLIGLTGLGLSALLPGLWLGCALLSTAGSAVILGICWQRWLDRELHENSRHTHEVATIILMFGVPAGAIISGIARIGLVYNFMERVQAVVCVGIALCVGAGLLIRFQRKAWYWVPAVCMAIALRLSFVNIYLPERDEFSSPRPYARAISRLIPPGETLYTQFPLDVTFRYYLATPTEPLSALLQKGSEPHEGHWHALVTQNFHLKNSAKYAESGIRVVRAFEGQTNQPMYLIRQGFDSVASERQDQNGRYR